VGGPQLLLSGAGLDPKGAGDNGVQYLGVLPDLEGGSPVELRAGDGLTLIFRLRRSAAAWGVPIGDLRLVWRRRECAPSPVSLFHA
jgi:hypothetical protein